MNALELADLIECACCAYQKEAGAMLRQQQAEIEAGIELIKKYQEERDDFHEHTKHWVSKCKELQNELNLYKLEDDDSKTVCHACDGTGLCDRA